MKPRHTASLIVTMLALGLVGLFTIARLARWRRDTTAAEARAAVDACAGAEGLRAWAAEYANRYPPDHPHYKNMTNGPLPAIRGRHPVLHNAMRDGPDDPCLADVSWDRHGAHVLIGTTNFRSVNPKATLWQPGIYFTEPDPWMPPNPQSATKDSPSFGAETNRAVKPPLAAPSSVMR